MITKILDVERKVAVGSLEIGDMFTKDSCVYLLIEDQHVDDAEDYPIHTVNLTHNKVVRLASWYSVTKVLPTAPLEVMLCCGLTGPK